MHNQHASYNNRCFCTNAELSNATADHHADRFLTSILERAEMLSREQVSSLASMGTTPSLIDRLTAQQQRAASVNTAGVGSMLSTLSEMRDQQQLQQQQQQQGRFVQTPSSSSYSQDLPYAQQLSTLSSTNGRLGEARANNLLHPNSSALLARQRLAIQNLAATSSRNSFTANANDQSFLLEAANLNDYPCISNQMTTQEALLRRALLGATAAPAPYVQLNQPSFAAARRSSMEEELRAHHALMASTGSMSVCPPVTLAIPEDTRKLSEQQVFLRHQIEAFQAGEDDISTHTRGRNKPIVLGQVGIRCKHCAHLSVVQKQKGSTYFPASLLGLYQAAQNMSTSHLQSGVCQSMPVKVKEKFAALSAVKVGSSGAGRPYWAKAAQKLGFVDTEDGIRFFKGFR